eukprot:COSAG01_NODE_1909_length_8928_cov_64.180315_15_plen_95_part_00
MNIQGGSARALIPGNGGWATGILKKCALVACICVHPPGKECHIPTRRREEIAQDWGSPMYCQMNTAAHALLTFLAFLHHEPFRGVRLRPPLQAW